MILIMLHNSLQPINRFSEDYTDSDKVQQDHVGEGEVNIEWRSEINFDYQTSATGRS